MIGAIANILRSHGINILLNIFFNPIVNAAQAIAHQVSSALTNFTNNFHTAVRPQITKSFSSGNIREMHDLIYRSSKFAFYLMMMLSIPLLTETEYILSIWLNEVPPYTVLFTRLIIVNSLIDVFNYPLVVSMQAVGKIRGFQLFVSVLILLILPISYVLYRLGCKAETALIVSNLIAVCCFFPRLYFAKKIANISVKIFLKKVLLVVLFVSILSMICPIIVYYIFESSLFRLLLTVLATLVSSLFIIYNIGLDYNEKNIVKTYLKKMNRKIRIE
jgi:O-antigen/teichoic acid export membrane protein